MSVLAHSCAVVASLSDQINGGTFTVARTALCAASMSRASESSPAAGAAGQQGAKDRSISRCKYNCPAAGSRIIYDHAAPPSCAPVHSAGALLPVRSRAAPRRRIHPARRAPVPFHRPGGGQPHLGRGRDSRRSRPRITRARPRAASGNRPTTDARYIPIFDSQPVQAIGALALAASDHKIVWAGTGEAWAIRDSDMMGNGVYKSTDAGQTWTHMGLDETGRIGRIVIHPTDPNIVYVCAAGRLTGPQQERGVFKTTDGGKTWTRSLFVDPNTGCSGLSMDSARSRTRWSRARGKWSCTAGGCSAAARAAASSSRTTAAPTGSASKATACRNRRVGKIDVAIAPKNSKRVYALIQTADQGSRLALRRWRRELGGRQLAARADRPRRLLHPHRGLADECRRGARRQQQLLGVHRRRQVVPRGQLGRRRHARYLDGSRRQAHHGHSRWRHEHHAPTTARPSIA